MSDPFDLDNMAEPAASSSLSPVYLEGLNEAQREAVETLDGPLLVLAGAGTGKTRVLTTRLVHLLNTGRAYGGQILAVTFTNKAALEMKERIGNVIGPAVEGVHWMGTFHSISAKILRRHAELVGLKSNFTILDMDDQLRLLKQLVREQDIDEKRWPPRLLAGLIDGWKNRGLKPTKVPKDEGYAYAEGWGIKLYASYQARLKILNAADFGDLLLHCLTLFQKHPDVLADYHRRFRYLMVDEYQDTNVAQYLWLRLLAQGHKNICCVGDDDQSIYGWRGAEVGNILRFEKDFDNAKVIRLEQNYRSTTHILSAAGGLIEANSDRLGKTLWTAEEGGEKVTVNAVWDGREEARIIGEMIEDYQRQDHALSEIAILVRTGFQTREFEERFITLGMPYRIIGGPRFYERAEIRDVMAYLRLVVQPADDLAFERIINLPKRGLGAATLDKLRLVARHQEVSLTEAARTILDSDELRPQARKSLGGLLGDFDRWRALRDGVDHMELTETILEESGYRDMWKMDKSPDAPGRLENLTEMVRGMEAFESLAEFLEHISLVMENATNNSRDVVNIMTLHGAKGLEFDTVFLPGWEEELFPSKRTLEESGERGLEEERRLAYVGLTRARKRAHIFHVSSRYMFGSYTSTIPSRFIEELPAEHVESVGQKGLDNYFAEQPSYQLDRNKAARKTDHSARFQRGKTVTSSYKVGERVFHDKFGYGLITELEGNKLMIDFEKSAPRKVMESFIKPA